DARAERGKRGGAKPSRAWDARGKRRERDEPAPRRGTIAPPLVDQGPRGGREGSRANSRLSWCGKMAARETARSAPAVSVVPESSFIKVGSRPSQGAKAVRGT